MSTPQTEPIPGSKQAKNNAGGYTWVVDDLVRLRRFICLGSEGGNYYTKEKELKAENAQAIARLIAAGRGVEVVNEIVEFSVAGRTAKQDPIIFALAMCARSTDPATKSAAYKAVPKICRIPTFLFAFVEFVEKQDPNTSGWGRGMRKAIAEWYLTKDGKDLAFTVTKYRQRNGWSHKDLLRLSHTKPLDDVHQLVFRYITKGPDVLDNFDAQPKVKEGSTNAAGSNAEAVTETLAFLKVVEEVSKLVSETDTERLCALIKQHHLAREHLPTQQLNHVPVWEAMLLEMPLTAMIRNLAKMTSIGLLGPGNSHSKTVADKLLNPEQLKRARIHPYNVLVAQNTYNRGRGEKGSLTWTPVPEVATALDQAFYLSFKFVEPTGQRVLVGLDVSGSMSCNISGSEVISCREAAMAMSLVMAKTEPMCKMMAFNNDLVPLNGVSPSKTLQENLQIIQGLPFGSTDCSLPMVWALANKVQADTFIVYTDNETYAGKMQPCQALVQYRKAMKIPHAKLIVVGMAVNEFTIADPNDRGMMDIAGFDSNAPEVMRNFMLGNI